MNIVTMTYEASLTLGLIAISPLLTVRALVSPSFRKNLRQRLGSTDFNPQVDRPLWLHAASAGEATSLIPLAKEIHRRWPEVPLVMTTMTEAGQRVLSQHCQTPHHAQLAPLDLMGVTTRLVNRWRPAALVITETELWPNMIRAVRHAGGKVVIVNGRISAESFRRYRWAAWGIRPLLGMVNGFGMSTEIDAYRVMEMGAPEDRVQVLGHSKFDQDWREVLRDHAFVNQLKKVAAGRPILVAGSTRPGEEEVIVEAMKAVWKKFPKALLIVAPRHSDRVAEVEGLLGRKGLKWTRRTQMGTAVNDPVLLLDTVGELSACYSVAKAAFVGGTLAPIGGHNVLEPASWSVPVTFGPHVGHVQEVAQALVARQGGVMVHGAEELAAHWLKWLESAKTREVWGNAAREVLRSLQGSTERNVDFLASYLDSFPIQDRK